jgi:hypothetical protein
VILTIEKLEFQDVSASSKCSGGADKEMLCCNGRAKSCGCEAALPFPRYMPESKSPQELKF